MNRVVTFYDLPKIRDFEPGVEGSKEMTDTLNRMSADTQAASPNSPRDLCLEYLEGKTQRGFRYTSEGFSRICKATAPNLSKVVEHIAGTSRHLGQIGVHNDAFSMQDACQIFNIAVNRRYQDWLVRFRIVLNMAQLTIDGVIGPSTHFVTNADFMSIATSVLPSDVEFAGASLAGRRLMARYLTPLPTMTPMGFMRAGFAFVVAEAGDDAIRAYRLYEGDNGSFLQTVVSPLKRAGKQKKFKERLRNLLQRTIAAKPLPLQRKMQELSKARLFSDLAEYSMDRVTTHWRRTLKLAHVPPNIADRVVARMTADDDPSVARFADDQLRMKSELDLLSALMAESRRSNQRVRELLERAAYSVFLGD